MANRDMSINAQNEINKAAITSYELIELELDDGTHRFTNGAWDAEYEGNTYHSIGAFLGFSDIQENTQMQIAEITVTLNGLNNEYIGYFASTDFIDRPARIYRQLWNHLDGVVGTFKIFEGRFKSAAVEDDGESIVVAGMLSNQFVDFERVAGRKTNDNEQQFFFPGDRFFEFADEVLREVKWAPPS